LAVPGVSGAASFQIVGHCRSFVVLTIPKQMRRARYPAGCVALLALAGLVAACGSQARFFRVRAGAMEPTLRRGEPVPVTPVPSTLHVGDIVVFHPPEGALTERCARPPAPGEMCATPGSRPSSLVVASRIVAGPGEEIYLKDGHIYRRAAAETHFTPVLDDTYIRECPATGGSSKCTYPKPITVPPGHWFVMGDNRGESLDSRVFGPVPTSWLVGVVRT
jgi:signal peptidase I